MVNHANAVRLGRECFAMMSSDEFMIGKQSFDVLMKDENLMVAQGRDG